MHTYTLNVYFSFLLFASIRQHALLLHSNLGSVLAVPINILIFGWACVDMCVARARLHVRTVDARAAVQMPPEAFFLSVGVSSLIAVVGAQLYL